LRRGKGGVYWPGRKFPRKGKSNPESRAAGVSKERERVIPRGPEGGPPPPKRVR